MKTCYTTPRVPDESLDGIPEDVARLVAEHITSVEQLEILLLLAARPGTGWTPKQVSEEIRTSESSAVSRLEDLRARGFLTAGDAGGFVFQPKHESMRAAVEHLTAVYRERRYTLIDLIFSKPIDRLRVYADAFRFRKDKSDG